MIDKILPDMTGLYFNGKTATTEIMGSGQIFLDQVSNVAPEEVAKLSDDLTKYGCCIRQGSKRIAPWGFYIDEELKE